MTLRDLINLPGVSLDDKILIAVKDSECDYYDHYFNVYIEEAEGDIFLGIGEED